LEGRDNTREWPRDPALKAYIFHGPRECSVIDLLTEKLLQSFAALNPALRRDEPYAVILASTKGMSEDFVWEEKSAGHQCDPLTPLLNEFLRRAELTPQRSLCISNACSSSLAALKLAERWMNAGIPQVLIVAADAVTPFVVKGFQALKLISASGVKSFSAERSGFCLGEAAAAVLVTKERRKSSLKLHSLGLDSEGSAVTRPSSSGASLREAALRIPGLLDPAPEILIAHGTGTVINDATEDLAFSNLFARSPWITGTKWCVGHTLAASGAVDLIAAAEALRAQRIFRLETTDKADPKFKCRYLVRGAETPQAFSRIMISSLGFGGMHASALVENV
jgi:3-oxoacyl-[acyl-carrier-protein] synthase-1